MRANNAAGSTYPAHEQKRTAEETTLTDPYRVVSDGASGRTYDVYLEGPGGRRQRLNVADRHTKSPIDHRYGWGSDSWDRRRMLASVILTTLYDAAVAKRHHQALAELLANQDADAHLDLSVSTIVAVVEGGEGA